MENQVNVSDSRYGDAIKLAYFGTLVLISAWYALSITVEFGEPLAKKVIGKIKKHKDEKQEVVDVNYVENV